MEVCKNKHKNSLSEIVLIYFKKITLLDIVQHKYVSAGVFLELMKMNYSYIDVINNLNVKGLTYAISRMGASPTYVQDNMNKMLLKEMKRLKNCQGTYQRITVYYVCDQGSGPIRTNLPWYADRANLIIEVPRNWTTRLNRNLVTLDTSELTHHTVSEESDKDNADPTTPTPTFETLTYWDSGLASSTFGYYDPKDKDQSSKPIEDVVVERMMKLRAGYKTFEGWKHNVEEHDKKNICTHYDIFMLEQKCKYISISLKIALEYLHMPDWTWLKCCQKAIEKVNELEGNDEDEEGNENVEVYRQTNCVVSGRTIQHWHLEYRKGDESFKNVTASRMDIDSTPSLFDCYPELKDQMLSYCKQNIENLTTETLYCWFHDIALPNLIADRKKEMMDIGGNNEEVDMGTILKEHGMTTLCQKTVLNWMTSMGFKYSPLKKSYYVDGHERPEVVCHRNRYIAEYIHNELRTFRWIQLPEYKVRKLDEENSGFSMNDGYKYNCIEKDVTMYEYHVDTHECLDEFVNDAPHGGYLSVRRDKTQKPLVMIGQDECIYKQYQMNNKRWILPDGTAALLPKDAGQGVMYSSFVSRDFGYGLDVNEKELCDINKKRKHEHYIDADAAKDVQHNSTKKKDLTCSPFVRKFDYGKNREGYWSCSHLQLQFEDVIDCLRHKFKDDFDYLFYFDNSSGHNKSRPNGLNVVNMNKKHGGAQSNLRDSTIKDESYLGKYKSQHTLNVGDVQQFTFKMDDEGPYYLSPQERRDNKHDTIVPDVFVTSELRTKDLIKRLNEGTSLNIQSYIPYKEAKALALKHGIPTSTTSPKVLSGWCNKPKGMMQILYERGIIDPIISVDDYKEKGLKLRDGTYDTTRGYKSLTANLPDFISEVTKLQYYASILRVTVAMSPKYHPEVAGEGIEFCWGLSKAWYRKQPLREKKNKQKFNTLVENSMDPNSVLDVSHVRKCAQRQ